MLAAPGQGPSHCSALSLFVWALGSGQAGSSLSLLTGGASSDLQTYKLLGLLKWVDEN
ncbi:hypothetical protein IG193_06575 [Infirmifilum lucidum]|uniref:Uncharacterized protein n=1 Tax=Infirmifilum lucidum TaxID=2776706 RepID=A0A7L9FI39_9CREN|nr:hypothetical protein [Infirmifilum lucidum]QOJ78415.1 hypothetical protein IG193_06575 [Infirmifilum lucidum]